MAGQLSINPYLKSYDELQRTKKRMQNYLDINNHLLDNDTKRDLINMIVLISEAIELVPEDFRVTKHNYSKKD